LGEPNWSLKKTLTDQIIGFFSYFYIKTSLSDHCNHVASETEDFINEAYVRARCKERYRSSLWKISSVTSV